MTRSGRVVPVSAFLGGGSAGCNAISENPVSVLKAVSPKATTSLGRWRVIVESRWILPAPTTSSSSRAFLMHYLRASKMTIPARRIVADLRDQRWPFDITFLQRSVFIFVQATTAIHDGITDQIQSLVGPS